MNESQCSLATVVSVGAGGLVLQFDGEDAARSKEYKVLGSYKPAAGHRVCVMPISGTYVVIGQVMNAPVTSLAADTAALATRAVQITNQNFESDSYDFQLRSTSASVFQIRRKNGATWGSWYTITMT